MTISNNKNKHIYIWPEEYKQGISPNGFKPSFTAYLLDSNKKLGAVLVIPGGSYAKRAEHEGRDIAVAFNNEGINAFVLNYRVAPARYPAQLFDACRALEIIRDNSDDWNIEPDQIAVCGFSAGGHLAGSAGTLFQKYIDNFPELKQNVRPDAMILCYPVITSGQYAHKGSFINLLGESYEPNLLETVSLEKQVSQTTPPTFIWHTAVDASVPVKNSLMFAESLWKNNISIEMHIYQDGHHGMGLAGNFGRAGQWLDECVNWLKGLGWNTLFDHVD